MKDLDIQNLFNKVGSIYKLVNLTAARAIELSEGSPNLVGEKPEAKTINIALREVADGKITYKEIEKK